MPDRTKTCLSVFAFISMLVLPVVGFLIGWIGWNIRTGILTASILFAVFFLLGGIFLAIVGDLSWVTVSLPLVGTTIYSILPNPLPSQIDDTVAMAAGAIFTFALWLRKQPESPKWIIFPLFMASLYTFVGGVIPGPVDELIVTAISGGTAAYGTIKSGHQLKQISINERGSNSSSQ